MVNTPVSRLIAGLAIPTVISMLVTSIYDIDLPDSKEQTASFIYNFKNRYIFRIYTFHTNLLNASDFVTGRQNFILIASRSLLCQLHFFIFFGSGEIEDL